MAFNFNSFANTTFPVTLNVTEDGGTQEREIHVFAPSVAKYKQYIAKASGPRDADLLLDLCSEMLSYNREGVKITPEDLSEMPLDAVVAFIQEFFTWISATRSEKN